jgi:hypothetical protein
VTVKRNSLTRVLTVSACVLLPSCNKTIPESSILPTHPTGCDWIRLDPIVNSA